MDYDLKKNCATLLRKAVGSELWQELYFTQDNVSQDILKHGHFSCAFFVSSILVLLSGPNRLLLDRPHATVKSIAKTLPELGWQVVSPPLRLGDVVIYEPLTDVDGRIHAHVGLAITSTKVISTSSHRQQVMEHDWQYRDTKLPRAVVLILRHPLFQ